MNFNQQQLKQRIKDKAHCLGFDKIGIAAAGPDSESENRLTEWLSAGYFGTMHWMEKRALERANIHNYFPEAKTVISVALNYYTDSSGHPAGDLKISNYALGDDYHDLMKKKLYGLLGFIQENVGEVQARVCVDTSPVMDKVWAQKAGLGWIGKHTNVITREKGSWLFLGELILDYFLQPDLPFDQDLCGSCTACINACPTDALVEPYILDARRCISYLTIENRADELPEELSRDFQGWIYGCDICQKVCPWNVKFGQPSDEAAFRLRPEIEEMSLHNWRELEEESFRRIFKGSAVRRTGFSRFQRNIKAAVKSIADRRVESANFDSGKTKNSEGE